MVINKEKALDIAIRKIRQDIPEIYYIGEELPGNCTIYRVWDEPCWYILCAGCTFHRGLLTSSRLICVSRETGRILYDGSANDEG